MIAKNPSLKPLPPRPDGSTEPLMRLATTREACRYARCGHTSLYKFLNLGLIDGFKRGVQTMIDLNSIDRMHAAMPKIQPRDVPLPNTLAASDAVTSYPDDCSRHRRPRKRDTRETRPRR